MSGGRINNTIVNAPNVSFAGSSAVGGDVLTHASTAVLSLHELRQAKQSVLLVTADGANTLRLAAADTAANAKSLADSLGLENQGDSCFLRIAPSANPTGTMSLTNGGATSSWIKIQLKGSAAASTQIAVNHTAVAGSPPSAEALIVATLTAAAAGAEIVTFNIIYPVAFNS